MKKYEIQGIVGEGAYGYVYKAKNTETGDYGKTTLWPSVAIKKFKDADDDESVRKTILREVKMLWMLKHPNII